MKQIVQTLSVGTVEWARVYAESDLNILKAVGLIDKAEQLIQQGTWLCVAKSSYRLIIMSRKSLRHLSLIS